MGILIGEIRRVFGRLVRETGSEENTKALYHILTSKACWPGEWSANVFIIGHGASASFRIYHEILFEHGLFSHHRKSIFRLLNSLDDRCHWLSLPQTFFQTCHKNPDSRVMGEKLHFECDIFKIWSSTIVMIQRLGSSQTDVADEQSTKSYID